MKKITLSAAILALTMMGCSESGLDNSVASTSEITDAQNQYSADFVPVLKNSLLRLSVIILERIVLIILKLVERNIDL